MTTVDAKIPDTRTPCPRCDTLTGYPAIVTTTNGPQFVLVCDYCGTHRPYPAPAIEEPAGYDRCQIDDVGACITHGQPIYKPGNHTRVPFGAVLGRNATTSREGPTLMTESHDESSDCETPNHEVEG